jgi:hypothetical protein
MIGLLALSVKQPTFLEDTLPIFQSSQRSINLWTSLVPYVLFVNGRPYVPDHRSTPYPEVDQASARFQRCCVSSLGLVATYVKLFRRWSLPDKNALVLPGFDQVYLDMINMIETEQDAKDVVTEFNAYLDVSGSCLNLLNLMN